MSKARIIAVLLTALGCFLIPQAAYAGIVGGLITALTPYLGAALAEAVVYGVISAALSAGLSAVTSAIFSPDAPPPHSSDISKLRHIQRGTTEPARVVYGDALISGVLAFARSVDPRGVEKEEAEWLHFVLAMCEGPIDDIFGIQLNDRQANEPGFANVAHFVPFTGSPYQEMIRGPFRVGSTQVLPPQAWLASNRPLKNIAGLYCILKHVAEIFPAGPPSVRARVRGVRLYDPREDVELGGAHNFADPESWSFSKNSALCVLNYLTDRNYGMGVPLSRIDIASFIAAADACDEEVNRYSTREGIGGAPGITGPNGPLVPPDREQTITYQKHPRYETDFVFYSDAKPIDVLETLTGAMAGATFFFQGKWYAYAGVPEAVSTWPVGVATVGGTEILITDDDLRDDETLSFAPSPGKKERINTLYASFTNPLDDYQTAIADAVTDAQFLLEDGGHEFAKQIELPGTADIDRARRICRIRLLEARLGARLTLPLKPRLNYIAPWSIVNVSLSQFGIGVLPNPPEKFRVIRIITSPKTGAPLVELAEYDDAIYTPLEQPVVLEPVSNLPDPFKPLKPLRVTAVEEIETRPDGSRTAKLVVTIVGTETGVRSITEGYRLRWRHELDSDDRWQSGRVQVPDTTFEILSLRRGRYIIEVRSYVGSVLSEPIYTTGRITYRTTAPRGPYPIAAVTQLPDSHERIFEWYADNPDPDVRAFQLFVREDPTGALGEDPAVEVEEAEQIASVAAIAYDKRTVIGTDRLLWYSHRTKYPTEPGNYIAYVRAIDSSDLVSETLATVKFAVVPKLNDTRVLREFSDNWLAEGAELVGGVAIRGRRGALIGRPRLTWQNIEDENPTTTWDQNSKSEIVYISPVVDLGDDGAFAFTYDVHVSAGVEWRVQVRTKLEEGAQDWSSWSYRTNRLARFAQFRLIAFKYGGVTRVHSFAVIARERVDDDVVEDFDTNINGAQLATIVEDGAAEFLAGEQDGLIFRNTEGMQLTLRPALICGPSTGVTVAHQAHQNLGSSFTLGATVMFDTDANAIGTVNIVAKGGVYGIEFIGGTGFKFFSTGFSGDDPNDAPAISIQRDDPAGGRLYEVVFTYDGHTLRGYLDGELNFSYEATFTIPSSTSSLIIANDGFEGPIRNVYGLATAWNRERVSALAHTEINHDDPDLRYYYKLDEGIGTTAVDSSRFKAHGTIDNQGWESVGWRRTPDIPLDIFFQLYTWGVSWSGTVPNNTSVTVEARFVDDSDDATTAWQAVPQGDGYNTFVQPGPGQVNTGNHRLECRQILRSQNFTSNPSIDKIVYKIGYGTQAGSATILANKNFHRIDAASVVGLQAANAGVTWSVTHKNKHGARFTFRNSDGSVAQPIVDVLFQGTLLGR